MFNNFNLEPSPELKALLHMSREFVTNTVHSYEILPEILLITMIDFPQCKANRILSEILPEDKIFELKNKLLDYIRPSSRTDRLKVSIPPVTLQLIQEAEVIARFLKKLQVDTTDIFLAIFRTPDLYAFKVLLQLLDLNHLESEGLKHIEFRLINNEKDILNLFQFDNNRLSSQQGEDEEEGSDEDEEDLAEDIEDLNDLYLQSDDDNKRDDQRAREHRIPRSRYQQSQQRSTSRTASSFLMKYAYDLTLMASRSKLDPIIGREDEIQRLLQILCRRYKNNPVLIGEPGVGKTAIVEGLAQLITRREVPDFLAKKRILVLDLASIVAGTKYRGQFEEKIKGIIQEVRKDGNIILFLDEMHTLVGTGSAEGTLDASNIFKPALSRGEIQCIGATTLNEFRKFVEKDGALERRFQKILVDPPSIKETIAILKGIKQHYEQFHQVQYSSESIEAAVNLSVRYINDRFLPDKAIDLIDEAGSFLRIQNSALTTDINRSEERLVKINHEKTRKKEHFLEHTHIKGDLETKNYDKLDELQELLDEEKRIKKKLDLQYKKAEQRSPQTSKITPESIGKVVSRWTGIPLDKINRSEIERLLKLEEEISRKIKGQHQAVEIIANTLRKARSGLKDPKRPLGVFLFLGYSGVGKTALARTLAETLFNTEDALIRTDMSEYMEKFNVSRLIGAPPGYVGYEEGGVLTEKIRRHPFSIVLLDEIEKAHPDVFNILLQIFDNGIITDSLGHKVDFRNTVIIMTSNLGTHRIKQAGNLGFSSKTSKNQALNYDNLKSEINKDVNKFFKPEFINRIDNTIIFNPLSHKVLSEIFDLFVQEINERLASRKIKIEFSTPAKNWILRHQFDPQYGARPIKRFLEQYLEASVVNAILQKKVKSGNKIIISLHNDKLEIKNIEPLNKKVQYTSS